MDRLIFEEYARDASRRGGIDGDGWSGAAGGSACGDMIRISVGSSGAEVFPARFAAEGCSAAAASAAAACELAEGAGPIEAALIDGTRIAEQLGGLGPEGRHAATLAADALHRALGAAAAAGAFAIEREPGRVLVAMSGGVDSSVAAHLARARGDDVLAVTVKLWSDPSGDGARSCCSPQAVLGAREIAHGLGIPHFTLDLEPAFAAGVVRPFIDGHAAGTTPNPCVRCNGSVRIDAMIELADRLGASRLLTGHYARITDDGEGPLLGAAQDAAKDQAYMLSALPPESLGRLEFPLAELPKPRVREIAAEAGLPVATRPDSQDLCFLAGLGKQGFLERHGGLGAQPGEIVAEDGRVLGRHAGQHRFTVGQRKGLGVAAGEPQYVLERDPKRNRVVVGPRRRLERRTVPLREAILHRPGSRVDRVRLRYHARSLPCRIDPASTAPGEHRELTVRLEEPAVGVAPGQTAALMDGEAIVGHATIA